MKFWLINRDPKIFNSLSQFFQSLVKTQNENFLEKSKSRRRWQNIYYIADELEYRGLLYIN